MTQCETIFPAWALEQHCESGKKINGIATADQYLLQPVSTCDLDSSSHRAGCYYCSTLFSDLVLLQNTYKEKYARDI